MAKEKFQNPVYFNSDGHWRDGTPEERRIFKTASNAARETRRKKQENEECACPRNKWYECDGVCYGCKYHRPKDESLDSLLRDEKGKENNLAGFHIKPLVSVKYTNPEEEAIKNELFACLEQNISEVLLKSRKTKIVRHEAVEMGKTAVFLLRCGATDAYIARVLNFERTTWIGYKNKALRKTQDNFSGKNE